MFEAQAKSKPAAKAPAKAQNELTPFVISSKIKQNHLTALQLSLNTHTADIHCAGSKSPSRAVSLDLLGIQLKSRPRARPARESHRQTADEPLTQRATQQTFKASRPQANKLSGQGSALQ